MRQLQLFGLEPLVAQTTNERPHEVGARVQTSSRRSRLAPVPVLSMVMSVTVAIKRAMVPAVTSRVVLSGPGTFIPACGKPGGPTSRQPCAGGDESRFESNPAMSCVARDTPSTKRGCEPHSVGSRHDVHADRAGCRVPVAAYLMPGGKRVSKHGRSRWPYGGLRFRFASARGRGVLRVLRAGWARVCRAA
jgi:hypothetical protein